MYKFMGDNKKKQPEISGCFFKQKLGVLRGILVLF
jgi:hypothetical protein